MKNRIWVLGDAVVDLIPETDGRLLKCPGGAPANVAVGIRRLGGESAFIGRVGDDPFGSFLVETLNNEGVNTEFMSQDPNQRTSTVVVENAADGERSFTFMVRPAADLFLQPSDLPEFKAGQFLHLCSIAFSAEPSRSAVMQAMTQIKAAGGYICFDPNIRHDLWPSTDQLHECLNQVLSLADVVKVSEDELEFLTGEPLLADGIVRLAERYHPKLLLVTQGKQGVSVYRDNATPVQQYPAPDVNAVDTTGAGDAFVAGLLAGLTPEWLLSSEQDWQQIIRQALACGALATTAKGAMTALPDSKQLADFYARA